MLSRLRQRSSDERGFTLIELLVVIVIIGVLAAIAIPSFLSQKGKANDASAKELARSAQTAAETVAIDNSGSYASVTPKSLNEVERTIPTASVGNNAWLSAASGAASEYVVTATAPTTENEYTIKKVGGLVTRTCKEGAAKQKGSCTATW